MGEMQVETRGTNVFELTVETEWSIVAVHSPDSRGEWTMRPGFSTPFPSLPLGQRGRFHPGKMTIKNVSTSLLTLHMSRFFVRFLVFEF